MSECDKAPGSSGSGASTVDDMEKERLQKELEEAQNAIKALQMQLNAQKERGQQGRPSMQPAQASSALREETKTIAPKPVRKEIGVSYDSSRMRSTLSHIDIEEMCRCLSKAIRKHILHAHEVMNVRNSQAGAATVVMSLPEFEGEAESGEQREGVQEAGTVKVARAAETLFNEVFTDERAISDKIPDETQIYYFCKNVVIKCRLEKECSVVCLIYIERLISQTGLYVTETNWKKLLFTSLVIASKVWDDESYDNANFAKAITLYDLRTINEMERTFLDFVQYSVHVLGGEYARYYFVLRTFAEKSNRSFPLRPLEVDVVRRLQSRSRGIEDSLRTQREKGGPITI